MVDVDKLLNAGIDFEGRILEAGLKIREESKENYGADRLDCRIMFVSILHYFIYVKSGIPGKSSHEISERLILISIFLQGVGLTETCISEGQYVKAAALLKQDYEILARLNAIVNSDAQYGKVPNVKHAPKGSQKFYGDLNDIAHISKVDILNKLMTTVESGEIVGIAPIPSYNKEISIPLYDLHIWLMFEVCREGVFLFEEMYGKETNEIKEILPWLIAGYNKLESIGFKSE